MRFFLIFARYNEANSGGVQHCTKRSMLAMYMSQYYTKILEVNLFAFAYRLFRRDFSPLDGTYTITYTVTVLYIT